MTSLKEHQATMVSMLASGTAIPTSAIRLAHALHDVLAYLNDTNAAPVAHTERRIDATTPGLNDVLLAADVQAVSPKQQSLESLLKQHDNTTRQLLESNMKLRAELEHARKLFENGFTRSAQIPLRPEQAGCRVPTLGSEAVNEASWFLHDLLISHGPLTGPQFNNLKGCFYAALQVALGNKEQEQSGVRKEDTQL